MSQPARETLAHVLLDRAAGHGDQRAYEYLHDDGRVDSISYRGLLDRAAGAAELLAGSTGPALLLYPPGLDFVAAVWGCLLAGVPAVPAYPPLFGPTDRINQRFARVLADARADALLADPAVLQALTASGPLASPLPRVLTLDSATPTDLTRTPAPSDIALIQYTSGSTTQPKGVVLDHRNLLANVQAIVDVFSLDSDARGFSWLPPYHDMGLIGCILTPVYGAFPIRLMSPLHFLKNPLAWLRQLGELGVTHTGGPNFAYDLCVRRARDADLSDVDLSSWRVAFNGAEQVRPRTLAAFADRFAGNGFRPEAFLPCYGLAEATLIVTGRRWAADGGVDERGRVDCGPVIAGHELAVVDPASGARVDGEGEIWVRGPSVSRGYWNDTGESEPFGDLDGKRYLRTGDLGYLRGGHLFVTGRQKDLLIQHGVNHHAHDLEAAAVEGNPSVRPSAAAFMAGDDEGLVLAVEVARRNGIDTDALAAGIRAAVLAGTGARVDVVVLCPPGAIPRTTSGKVQRGLARARFLAGELAGQVVVAPAQRRPGDPAAEPVERFLAGVFAAVCEVAECTPTQSLSAIGGDSVRAAEIAAVTENALALPVPMQLVLDAQTPRELTARLLETWSAGGVPGGRVMERIGALGGDPVV